MTDELDINEEYEKVFGKESHENIFSPDDEEYQIIRQSIVDAKRVFDFKRSLPFDGIRLYPYEDFLRNEIAREASSNGYRIFYIRKYLGGKLTTYAAGYFNSITSCFVVLKGAFFNSTEYYASLIRHVAPYIRMKLSKNYLYNNGVLTQRKDWAFDSASLAASYILGYKTTFREWRDDRSKTLDAYYTKYKSASIDDYEDKTFPDFIAPATSPKGQQKASSNNINSLQGSKGTTLKTKSLDLLKNFKKNDTTHSFFIKKDSDPTRYCDVSGFYDPISQKFIMKYGSILSLETTCSYNSTPQGRARSNFLNKYCTKETMGYKLKKDCIFDSPSAAASYAIGSAANGWTAWKDSQGKTLADIYRNIASIK